MNNNIVQIFVYILMDKQMASALVMFGLENGRYMCTQ